MTPSKLLSRCSPPDAAQYEAPLRNFLASLCGDAERHARFLNTLSLLEHIGSRKILLTQGDGGAEDALKHLAEETRHAHFFRRAAEKIGGRKKMAYTAADSAAPATSKMYFGRLDSGISAITGPGELAYLYVTQAIEVRAGWLYKIYEEVLRVRGETLSLRSVIAEEDAHLSAMDAELRAKDPAYARRSEAFAKLESRLFAVWWEKTTAALAA